MVKPRDRRDRTILNLSQMPAPRPSGRRVGRNPLMGRGTTLLRRTALSAILAGLLAVASVGTAFAHECVISSRSDRGNEGATHSKVWDRLYLADILGFAFGLNEAQAEWAVENRGDLPEYWVTNIKKTIGEGSSNPNLADGKGLDHLEQLVGGEVFLLAQEAMAAVPSGE